MVAALKTQNDFCRPAEIAAYVDGELDSLAQLSLENHLEECGHCRDELRDHQSLICQLDAALIQGSEMEMPAGFSKFVAARASSDMSGMRSAVENRRALLICVLLGIAGFALVGVTLPSAGIARVRHLAEGVKALLNLIGNAVYDLMVSLSVIARVISRKFLFESRATAVALVIVGVAVFLLSRLIVNYHRSSAAE